MSRSGRGGGRFGTRSKGNDRLADGRFQVIGNALHVAASVVERDFLPAEAANVQVAVRKVVAAERRRQVATARGEDDSSSAESSSEDDDLDSASSSDAAPNDGKVNDGEVHDAVDAGGRAASGAQQGGGAVAQRETLGKGRIPPLRHLVLCGTEGVRLPQHLYAVLLRHMAVLQLADERSQVVGHVVQQRHKRFKHKTRWVVRFQLPDAAAVERLAHSLQQRNESQASEGQKRVSEVLRAAVHRANGSAPRPAEKGEGKGKQGYQGAVGPGNGQVSSGADADATSQGASGTLVGNMVEDEPRTRVPRPQAPVREGSTGTSHVNDEKETMREDMLQDPAMPLDFVLSSVTSHEQYGDDQPDSMRAKAIVREGNDARVFPQRTPVMLLSRDFDVKAETEGQKRELRQVKERVMDAERECPVAQRVVQCDGKSKPSVVILSDFTEMIERIRTDAERKFKEREPDHPLRIEDVLYDRRLVPLKEADIEWMERWEECKPKANRLHITSRSAGDLSTQSGCGVVVKSVRTTGQS